MAEVEKTTKKIMVEKAVDLFKLWLSPDEFVSLRTFLGSTSYNDIIKADLDKGDDKRIEAIYTVMSNLDGR